MAEDLPIHIHVRHPGEPPPDPRAFTHPVSIPGWVRVKETHAAGTPARAA